jgi:hypothetical protein
VSPHSPAPRAQRSPGRPAIVVDSRDGDPRAGAAIVVDTSRAKSPRAVAVALAAVLRDKLGSDPNVRVFAQASSIRIDNLMTDHAALASWVDRVRLALVARIDDVSFAKAAIAVEHASLALEADGAALADCRGARGAEAPLSREALELARVSIVGDQSVAIGVVGVASITEPAVATLAKSSIWPENSHISCAGRASDPVAVYPLRDRGAMRIDVVAQRAPSVALGAARALGDPHAVLLAKLREADPSARVVQVFGTALPSGGCVDVSIEVPARDPVRIARLAALARAEIEHEASAPPDAALPDPRDAASLLAAADLYAACEPQPYERVLVGIAPRSDASPRAEGFDAERFQAAITTELDAATRRWAQPAIAAETLIESGQPEAYVLLASSCGTRAETGAGLGTTLSAMSLLARHAHDDYGIEVEPFVGYDAAGLLAHARARAGESAVALGARLAEAASRAMLLDALPSGELQPSAAPDDALVLLAETLVPAHETWLDPRAASALRPQRNLLATRLESVRRGPLQAVVLANGDAAQAAAMAQAIDRFVARDAARACPADIPLSPAKPGTYAADRPGASVAYLAVPVPAEPACGASALLAAALRETWLPRSLSGVARTSDARLIALPSSHYLAVRLEAPGAALDASVSQVRALFDRLRRGAIDSADLSAATAALARERLDSRLDPRARVVAAFRKEAELAPPRPDDVKACAAAMFRDEALIIATARGRAGAP